jgi:hypothetical protein
MNSKGYILYPFPQDLLQAMRSHVCHFFGVAENSTNLIEQLTEKSFACSEEQFITRYAKTFRIFPDSVASIAEKWIESLAKDLGGKRAGINYVSEEEKSKNKILRDDSLDVFWRCVRPGKPDVGAAHCDYQFWEIVRGTPHDVPVPFEYDERWKIWVPLLGCVPSNSLEVVPTSHNQEIPIDRIITRNGYKPSIQKHWLDANEKNFLCPLTTFEGFCVLFHDKLVHRGPQNTTQFLRVSGELTILLETEKPALCPL